MKRSNRLLPCLLLVWLCLAPHEAFGQRHRLLPDDDWTYAYVARLQRRGYLLELHPTAPPYTQDEVWRAVDRLERQHDLDPVAARWVRLLRQALRPVRAGDPVLAASIEGGTVIVNNDRRDVLRRTSQGRPTMQAGALRFFPAGEASVLLEQGRVVADLRLHFDLYYRDDPDALDAANRLIVRNAGYVGYDGAFVSVYGGRFDTHWGVPGEPALLVSDNPAPFDRLYLRLGGGRLALRSLLGELDSITRDGRFTGVAGADSVAGSERRYLAAHRLDWRPSRRLALTFMEANLYSGANSGLSLKYLNPLFLHAFLVDEPAKNDENNGLLAGILWLQYRRLTLHGQLLLDDVDLLGEGAEPASLALAGSLTYAGAAPGVDLGAHLTVVSSRAYNTHQPEGRYVFLLRGLGTQFNDYVHAGVSADFYPDRLLPGVIVTARLDHLRQGEHDLRLPFPSGDVPFVLSGDEARVTRAAAVVAFQRDPRFWARLDAGVNVEHAGDGAPGRVRPSALLAFGARFSLARPVRLRLP